MSNIDKQAVRIPERNKHNWGNAVMRDCDFCQQWALTVRQSDGGCICASYCDSEYTTALSSALVVALDELEAAERRNAELTEALKQTVSGYKSCLHTGHERILDLGGDCDAPEVMIAGNTDIQQAEKLLSAAAGKGE